MIPADPDYVDRVTKSFQQQSFMTLLGAQLTQIDPGEVCIELDQRHELTQQHDFVHAGAIASIADSACGYAALTLMPADAAVLTVEFKINLLSPAVGDQFCARGIVRKAGTTLTYAQADVLAQNGDTEKLVASLVATIMTIRNRGISD